MCPSIFGPALNSTTLHDSVQEKTRETEEISFSLVSVCEFEPIQKMCMSLFKHLITYYAQYIQSLHDMSKKKHLW